MDKIIKKVREFVKKECEKPGAGFVGCFDNHFKHVVGYARELARREKADEEIVEIAAWLHDIGSVKHEYKKHHLVGAEIAEDLLKNLKYPQDKIEEVKHCILHHRGSYPGNPETKEAQVLIDADSMAHFDEIDFLVNGKYYGAKTMEESKKNVLAKLERSYMKLSPAAKEITKPKLVEARKILK